MTEHERQKGRPPGYELFFAPLKVAMDPTAVEGVKFAYIASKYGHAGQIRDDGSRYFDHPKAAAWIYIDELCGRDPRVVIVLLLHDLSEDAYLLSPYRIGMNFGEAIAMDIRALTKLPKGKETTAEYLNRVVAQGPWATLAKLCDRLHNLRDLKHCTPDKQARQLEETERFHLPILLPALREHGDQWEQYANELEEKVRHAISICRSA